MAAPELKNVASLLALPSGLRPSPHALEAAGLAMHALATELFPLPRSLTGEGLRATLRLLGNRLPVQLHEVPTGTAVFDWDVPREWRVREAYITAPNGDVVVDYRDSNLHLLHHSIPFRGALSLEDLQAHLYSLPDHPDWFSFRASYYQDAWGFCLSHRKREALQPGKYQVVVDTELFAGSLTYGEVMIPGESDEQVLISAHSCHPSLANDNLSGMVVATALGEVLMAMPKRRYTYRILFAPATLGALAFLMRNEKDWPKIKQGLVLALLGDKGPSTYKKSRLGNAKVDRLAAHVLKQSGQPFEVRDFIPFGYDERQFNSPGIDLPMGCLMRTPNGEFAEYHTCADNLEFIKAASLADSLGKVLAIVDGLERDARYLNLSPKGEPRLGKRGLYQGLKKSWIPAEAEMALFWVLSYSDGAHSLLDIAERAQLPFGAIADAAQLMLEANLLKSLSEDSSERLGRMSP